MSSPALAPQSRRRWTLAALFGFCGFVGYLDRVNLSVIATPIAHDLHLSDTQLGTVLSAFFWSYALAQIPAGVIVDRFGTRLPVIASILVWAVSSLMSATVGSLLALGLVRLLLGLAEAPIYPAMWRGVALHFSASERGRAMSCLDSGSKLSFVFGVPLIAGVLAMWGWRACFVVTAGMSLFCAGLFALVYPREGHVAGRPQARVSIATSLRAMVPTRPVAGVAVGFAAYTYVFYLLSAWMPRLIEMQLGVSTVHAGYYTALPWLVAVVGEAIVAGYIVDACVAAGRDPVSVRKLVLSVSLCASLALVGAAYSHSPLIVLGCLTCSATGLAISTPTGVSLIGFVAGRDNVGAVGASVNLAANLAGACAPALTGFLLQRTGSFLGAALGAACVVVIGVGSYAFVVPGRGQRETANAVTDAPDAALTAEYTR
ncbi:major facilitator superfamily transporter [Ameyamaea chiangmaiensis NBRC 103196]|uniref:MFS transporter n=1 Tax=Ameyamaea chiangmaiensis TaxID=442969 RepID=A0A850PD73_9PROT|nr:MFS transporter [Ameyamaea chiangmaiensis]MBS4075551.1 MFS transporter [Ameyamaea chiangmaiensis]NVN40236.1 MFS transporter [Ameyamaea chiangmaiensis]GBQ69350.1 major facilitator superfamily transporter [Ameyamaea chiangmaiensis NBRC 103196]